ncbi:MAG TPA: DUF2029 domain-containing protein [Deltaproteobacteria bacterium]|nr:DUF2029 domain-containing protein [Deltaproteobacteria bacterium]
MDVKKSLFIFLAALAVVYGGYGLGRAVAGPKQGLDYAQYYMAGRMVVEGDGGALYESGPDYQRRAERYGVEGVVAEGERLDVMTNAYPPFVALLSAPLALVPYDVSRFVFLAASVAASALAALLLFAGRDRKTGGELRAAALAATFIFFPLHYSLYMGQMNSLLLVLLVAALQLGRRGRQVAAGLLLGAAAAIKLFPLVLAAFFALKRQYTLAATAAASAVILSLSAMPVTGADVYAEYFTAVLPSQLDGGAFYRNQGVPAVLSRLLTENDVVASLGHHPTLVTVLSAAAAVVALGAVFYFTKRNTDEGRSPYELEFSLVLAATIMVLSKSWEHYAVFLLPAYLFLYERFAYRGSGDGGTVLFLAALSYCVWSFVLTTGCEYRALPYHVLSNIPLSAKFTATLVLYLCVLYVVGRRDEGRYVRSWPLESPASEPGRYRR